VIQSEKLDPDEKFIRQYVPELSAVPARYIHAPWKMSAAEQRDCGVLLGKDFPTPIVDHAAARNAALKLYGKAQSGGSATCA
jgi:deoxyribodipyrimidine photo-lyase